MKRLENNFVSAGDGGDKFVVGYVAASGPKDRQLIAPSVRAREVHSRFNVGGRVGTKSVAPSAL